MWSSVEASERPAPPWNINIDQSEEWVDFEHGAWRIDDQYTTIDSGKQRVTTKLVLEIDSPKPIEDTSVLGGLHVDYRRAA